MGSSLLHPRPPLLSSHHDSLALRLLLPLALLAIRRMACCKQRCNCVSLFYSSLPLPHGLLFFCLFHLHGITFPVSCGLVSHPLSSLFYFPPPCLCVRVHVCACAQDMMDDICQEQFMEMSYLNGGQDHGARGRGGMPVRGRGVPPAGGHRWGRCTHTQDFWHDSCLVTEIKQRHCCGQNIKEYQFPIQV